jgi:hypothetical protein
VVIYEAFVEGQLEAPKHLAARCMTCLLRASAPQFGPAERLAAIRELAEFGDLESARSILFDFQRETGLPLAIRRQIAMGLKLLNADGPDRPEEE